MSLSFGGPKSVKTPARGQYICPVVIWRTCLCLLLLSLPTHAASPTVDYSNYNVPLSQQIVERIKARIATRIGPGKNERDRFFMIPFAYENDGNDPEFSHSFLSVVRVLED